MIVSRKNILHNLITKKRENIKRNGHLIVAVSLFEYDFF